MKMVHPLVISTVLLLEGSYHTMLGIYFVQNLLNTLLGLNLGIVLDPYDHDNQVMG
jgi:hypothetical protein